MSYLSEKEFQIALIDSNCCGVKEFHNIYGYAEAKPIVSCLIESLVWNVPNEGFGHSTLTADVRYTLAHLFNNTRKDEDCSEWGEVNELKYLFRSSQPWTRQQAHDFVSAAWNYIGFE